MARDGRIDEYLTFAAPFARPILLHLRKLIHRACPDVEEGIKWNVPFFSYRGKVLCYFAEFKAHTSFGFWHRGMQKVVAPRHRKKSGSGMGMFGRIARREDLPDDRALLKYLKAAMAINEADVKPAAKRKVRADVPAPSILVDALRRNRPAQEQWLKFSPSARREYIEWIVDAKREETREHRLLATLEWVAEGKKRNWKYEKC